MKQMITLFTTLLLLCNLSYGQNNAMRIDSIVNAYHSSNPEIGISMGFIDNGQEFYSAYGTTSRETNARINEHSVFELVSITKILTANLVALAANEGKLTIDAYIDDYLPQDYKLHPNLQQKVKISDLASHQSGLPDIDFRALIERNPQQPTYSVTRDTINMLINNCTQLIDHGNYRYSTLGYALLGHILENVYDRSYEQLVHDKFIQPLQLIRTLTLDYNVDNITAAYNPEGGSQELFEWNTLAPAGLVKSSAYDMIQYLRTILSEDNDLARAATLAETPVFQEEGRVMGLGLSIVSDDDNTIYLKSGDSMGQSCFLCYNRDKNWGIIIFLNQRNSSMRQHMLNDIYEEVLK